MSDGAHQKELMISTIRRLYAEIGVGASLSDGKAVKALATHVP